MGEGGGEERRGTFSLTWQLCFLISKVDNPSVISEELSKQAMEGFLKEMQWFPDDIRSKLDEVSSRGRVKKKKKKSCLNNSRRTEPNRQRWHAKDGSSVGMRTRCTRVFARLGARLACSVGARQQKFSASELRRKFIRTALLAG